MTTRPLPIAIRLDSDVVLRGHEWSVDGPAVLFLHDLGDDLDSWGSITGRVADHGFRVISVELPGHGLSDGDVDLAALGQQIGMMLREVCGSFGPVAVATYGSVAELLLDHGDSTGVPVQVMVSPSPLHPAGIDWAATTHASRLVLSGTLNAGAHGHVEAIYPKLLGPHMLVTAASAATGPDLLADQPQLLEHLVMFVRRYLTGPHLQWIAEHADQIEAAGAHQQTAPGTD